MQRPDLSDLPEEVVAYILALEEALAAAGSPPPAGGSASFEPSEPPTTINVITVTAEGLAKRTPRHLYGRQRRSGMGVFDIEGTETDPPAILAVADEAETILVCTSNGRIFRLPVASLPETPVRGRGQPLAGLLPLLPGERPVAVLPDSRGAYLALASERGWVRRVRASFVGQAMFQGTSFHDAAQGGPLVAACWSSGDEELLLVTGRGQALRFAERHVRDRQGCLGMRVDPDDRVVAIAAVSEASAVFLVGQDGKGTIRLMSGLRANKAPGAGGKAAIKADDVRGAVTVREGDDLFLISRLSKIIRFAADEVPAKEGVVQGVNCMSLRADEVVAVTVSAN